MKNKRKKELYGILLFILIIGITIGYAALNATININGSSKIRDNLWEIYFDNIVVNPDSISLSTGDSDPTIEGEKHLDYTITLQKPGDFYEFTVDIVNSGTIDAMIENIESKLNNNVIGDLNPIPSYIDYSIRYVEGNEVEIGNPLFADSSETIKIRIEFKKDINEEQLPAGDVTLSWSYELYYIQLTEDSSIPLRPIRLYSVPELSDNTITNNEAFPVDVTKYYRFEDLVNKTGSHVALKHKMEGDYVRESFLAFEITESDFYNYPSSTQGIYTLKSGGAEFDDLNGPFPVVSSIYYPENKEILNTAFGEENCEETSGDWETYTCQIGNMQISVDTLGSISTYDYGSLYDCYITGDTASCYKN